jgi:signal transduction histidine kinase/ActR/RegA family two-component response regulator
VLGDVEGASFGALLHPADRAGALDWLEERSSSLGLRAYRCRLRAPEGEWRDIELRAQDRRDDPAVEGFVINARDVSHETALEQALGHSRKLAMLSEMAGRIAHSFNNTLAALQVHAEVLARDLPEGALAREDARAIGAAAERGAGITRQLLGFSGRHVIRPEALRPVAVLESLRNTLAQLLGPGRTCAIVADAPDATVLVDRAQLEQVIVNLVANARDAMPGAGTVTLRVALESPSGTAPVTTPVTTDPVDGTRVVIEVSDQGTGIPAELLPRVFEPFFSTKAPGRGTGLGLAMVASIVRRAGGTVEIHSEVGVGTRVRLLLPAQRRVPRPLAIVAAADEAPAVSARVLLVDDDALVRRASVRMLQRAGYAVVDAEDGATALAIAADPNERIDLLLTDLMMPGLSGREVVARFRVLRPGVPIVCITGFATERADDRSLALEVHAIIAKPFTSAGLQQALREALRSGRPIG